MTRLSDYVRDSKDLASSHPAYALAAARSAAEAICHDLYEANVGTPGNARLEDLLRKLTERSIIPIRIQVPLRTLQAYGNLGVHDSADRAEIDSGFILPALQALDTVVSWYLQECGIEDETTGATGKGSAPIGGSLENSGGTSSDFPDLNGDLAPSSNETHANSDSPADSTAGHSGTDIEVIQRRSTASTVGDRSSPAPAKLCGRLGEKSTLLEAIESVGRSGSGGKFVLLSGESGSGKSALARDALGIAESHGFATERASCEPFHEGMAFFPIREILRRLSPNGPVQDLTAAFGAESIQASLARLSNQGDAEPGARRDALVATFANLVFAQAKLRGKPVLLFVDDLERIDAGSADALTCLIARLSEGPVLLLGSYRNDVVTTSSSDHPLRPIVAVAQRTAALLPLGPLADGEIDELVRAVLAGPVNFPPSFRKRLREETEGNPLYIREVLKNLSDGGTSGEAPIRCVAGTWQVVHVAETWDVPRSIEDAISGRLNGLPDQDRALLELASVIGRRFPYTVLIELSRLTDDDVIDSLERMIAHELIAEIPDADELFEFTHGKIRDILYNQMTGLRRQRVHGQVADILSNGSSSLPTDEWEVLVGNHLFAARRYDAAAPHLIKSGERALSMQAGLDAARYFDRARQALEKSTSTGQHQLDEITFNLGVSYKLAAEMESAEQQFRLLRRDGTDPKARRWALNHLGDILLIRGRITEALQQYEECEELAIDSADVALRAETAADLAELHMRQSERLAGVDPEAAAVHRERYDRYLEIEQDLAPRTDDNAMLARAYRNSAKRARSRDLVDVAIALYEQSLQYVDEGVNSHQFLIPYAKALRLVDRYHDATRIVERVLEWSLQLGARRSEAIARQYLGLIRMEMSAQDGDSDFSAAEAQMIAALEIHSEVGFQQGRRETQVDLGELQIRMGDDRAGRELFRLAVGDDASMDDDQVATAVLAQLRANGEHRRANRLESILGVTAPEVFEFETSDNNEGEVR